MINLIPSHLLHRREKQAELHHWLIRIFAVTICCVIVFLGSRQIVAGKIAAVELTKIEYNNILTELNASRGLIAERDQLWQRWETIATLHTPRTSAWHLELLSQSLPKECYIRSLNLSLPAALEEGAEVACVGQLRLSGSALSHGQVSVVIHSLSCSNAFANVNLLSISDPGGAGAAGEILFEMNCVTNHNIGRN